MINEDTYLDGSTSFSMGQPLKQNPHDDYTAGWFDWREGWLDSYTESTVPEELK